ncbi:nucleotidyltransferase domain-containing protein [Larkinella punicea]|uniref:Cyclic GMP-AMP synthase n=1 Tax=Larkinella punicea TaxID=2315727 RepID=A0A368JYE6_9BACT|nr:nucleotidyltransferase [Larkinella punicea]RCR71251.1 nucleotidyltransferase [Larkinella punicea]
MANVQKQFDQYHNQIKLRQEETILAEKRDIIRKKLKENLPKVFEDHDEENLVPEFCDQGSYEMGTGIKPLDGEYDIDQGVYFPTSKDNGTYAKDPVLLKERVHEALEGHTKDVCIRRPCVTVFYQKDGERVFHVDLAIYSDSSSNTDNTDYLAMGKRNSGDDYREWQRSNPTVLKDTFFRRFSNDEPARKQFRRVIRYMKRWKDLNFSSDGNNAPRGIGLTISAHEGFMPKYSDPITYKPDDLEALLGLVNYMVNSFFSITRNENGNLITVRRLTAYLPVEPNTDIYARMSDSQMQSFEDKLKNLKTALEKATSEVDTVEACKILASDKVLGDCFPIPTKEATAVVTKSAAVASSSNAG